MGLSLTDQLSLIKNGYKVSEIAEVNTMVNTDAENGNNIIELAKKLQFSDLKQAIDIFKSSDDKKTEKHDEEETDKGADDHAEEKGKDSSADDQAGDDDVDYKKLYEEEKSLRISLQQKNQLENNQGAHEQMSDFDIALQAAVDVLN